MILYFAVDKISKKNKFFGEYFFKQAVFNKYILIVFLVSSNINVIFQQLKNNIPILQ